MRIEIKTPVWTGDIDQKSELLKSTGIMGSLRWWTEAILRSDNNNRYACDPTSDERCPKEERNEEYYCSACLIFGATGIRRTFRLNVSGGRRVFTGSALNIKPSGRNKGWYLGSGVVGEINLEITPLDKDFDKSLVLLPLIIASKWGGIGAKTQHGYGVVKIEDYPEINFNRFKDAIKKITAQERLSKLSELSKLRIKLRHGSNNGLPDLREMFFTKVQFEVRDENWWKQIDGIKSDNKSDEQRRHREYENDQRMINWVSSGSVPIAPAIKNWLRFGKKITTKEGKKIQVSPFSEVFNKRVSNWLFGNSEENNKTASKINISCAYPVNDNLWEFRIWGWIPKDGIPQGFDRGGFLNSLKQTLRGGSVKIPWNELLGNQTKNHKLKVWREFDSPRDTVKPNARDTIKPNESNIDDYIQSLLNTEVE